MPRDRNNSSAGTPRGPSNPGRPAPNRGPVKRISASGRAQMEKRQAAARSKALEAKAKPAEAPAADGGERIQKVLASAGVASRRAVEALIADGKVTVNGAPATVGQKVGARDRIAVDGHLVRHSAPPEAPRVLLFKKRVGELVTRDDPEGRKTVFRKLPELETGRWISIGRLDINTSGLLLLTNHGELARRLMHPSFEMRRQYAVRVLGAVDDAVIKRLCAGIELDDGPARFESMELADFRGQANDDDLEDDAGTPTIAANRWYRVTVAEGRNRVVRRLLESQTLQVSRLIRIAYGPVTLGSGIKSGSYRELDRDEVTELMAAVSLRKDGTPRAF